jgi:lipopolysaccharide transport system permease protein
MILSGVIPHPSGRERVETIIERSHGWSPLRLRELWDSREVLYFLMWRDVKLRYKQTALGAAWAILQPLFTMLVFTLVFARLGKIPSDGVPYPIFSYAGLIPWTFFANGLTMSSGSVVASANTIKKVYFPRLAIPIATVLAGAIDFLFALSLLVVMMLHYRTAPSWNIVWLPAFLLLALVTSLAAGLWLSALNVLYRDVRYVVPFLVQFWLLATPIAYPSSMLQEPLRSICGLNPMAGVVEGFRWSILGVKTQPGPIIAVSAAAAVVLLIAGAFYFKHMEKTFADIV